jgi:hypothetical protein
LSSVIQNESCVKTNKRRSTEQSLVSMTNSQFMRQTGSDTGLDSVSATGRKRSSMGTKMPPSDPALAKRVYVWNLEILQLELANLTVPLASAQESLLGVLAEVLSRLTFKVDASELAKAFPVVLNFHSQPGIQSHMLLHASCEPWFRRLYEAADRDLLLEWLSILIPGWIRVSAYPYKRRTATYTIPTPRCLVEGVQAVSGSITRPLCHKAPVGSGGGLSCHRVCAGLGVPPPRARRAAARGTRRRCVEANHGRHIPESSGRIMWRD